DDVGRAAADPLRGRRRVRRDPARAQRTRARRAPERRRIHLPQRSGRAAPDGTRRRATGPGFDPPHPRTGALDMRGNIAQLMQQAQKMQENLQKAQAEMASIEVTGSAGGGLVTVPLSGTKECRKVRIDPSVLSDPEMAEDLVAAAFNDASNKVDAESQSRMGAATAGMALPPGMKMPF